MQINKITSYPYNKNTAFPSFEAKGKPLDLQYVYQNRRYLLPKRVENAISNLISQGYNKRPSVMEVHKSLYKPLLQCETLEKAKILYPEFKDVLPETKLQMNSTYAKKHGTTVDEKFVLKLLQEYWAKLRTKDEIAQEFGIKGRQTLDWTLKKINFVTFDKNYRGILLASDPKGNKEIADKTVAWNKANPEIRQALNKHAAQGCKTEKYIAAQRARMYQYDATHPERIQKITEFSRDMWEQCQEVKDAMSAFTKEQPEYVQMIIRKKMAGKTLNSVEKRIYKAFYANFWKTHPEMKNIMSDAAAKVRGSRK